MGIVNTFENLAIFILKCPTVRFMTYLRGTENVNGTQKCLKVPFVTVVKNWRDTEHFCS